MSFIKHFTAEWKRIFQHKELSSLMLVTPLIYCLLLPGIYWHQSVKEVPVGVVDLDNSSLSREVVRRMDATEGIRMSDTFLDLEEAKVALHNHDIEGLLLLPRSFSRAFKGNQSTVAALGVTSSNLAVAGPILTSAATVAQSMASDKFRDTVSRRNLHRSRVAYLSNALSVDIRPIYNPELSQLTAMTVGLIFLILQQIIIMAICWISAEEKELNSQTLPDLRIRSIMSYIMGRSMPYAGVAILLALSFFFLLLPFFGIPVGLDRLPAYILLCAFFVSTVSLLGFMMGLFFKDRITVMVVLTFYSMPGFLTSGYSWPEASLPLEMRIFGYFFPVTHFVGPMRQVILGPIGAQSYFSALTNLGIYSLICFSVAFLVLRNRIKSVATV